MEMNKKTVLTILSRFKAALELEGIRVDDLIMFGSYITNTYREGSEIGVVVVSDDFKGKRYWKRIDIISNAVYQEFSPIEAIAVTPEEWQKRKWWIHPCCTWKLKQSEM